MHNLIEIVMIDGYMKLRIPFVDKTLVSDFCHQIKIRDGCKSKVPEIVTHDRPLPPAEQSRPFGPKLERRCRWPDAPGSVC